MAALREELLALEGTFGQHLFARGYLISASTADAAPSHWVEVSLPNAQSLWHDPRTPHVVAKSGRSRLHVVGDLYSVRHPRWSGHRVAKSLARAISRSDQHFYEALDMVHGRFVLLYYGGSTPSPRITSDATGMRAIFYAPGAPIVGSHAALVAAAIGEVRVPSPFLGYGQFGRSSGFGGVMLVTPNHELDIAASLMRRYWPREPIEAHTAQDSAELTRTLLAHSLAGVARRHTRLTVSLTAGTDSRTSLAMTVREKITHRVHYVTYVRAAGQWIDDADLETSRMLVELFGLRHHVFKLADAGPVPPEWRALLEANSTHPHLPTVAYVYAHSEEIVDSVHLRSNLSEIGRCFYLRKRTHMGAPTTGADLAEIYFHSMHHGIAPPTEGRSVAVAAFEEMFEATEFAAGARYVDGRDLFYWEHRMGSWHSQVVSESDVAFDSLSLYNSRAVLTAMLSAPQEDRLADTHLHELLYSVDPRLLEIPLNKRPGIKGKPSPVLVRKLEEEAVRRARKAQRTAGARRGLHRFEKRVPGARAVRVRVWGCARRISGARSATK